MWLMTISILQRWLAEANDVVLLGHILVKFVKSRTLKLLKKIRKIYDIAWCSCRAHFLINCLWHPKACPLCNDIFDYFQRIEKKHQEISPDTISQTMHVEGAISYQPPPSPDPPRRQWTPACLVSKMSKNISNKRTLPRLNKIDLEVALALNFEL